MEGWPKVTVMPSGRVHEGWPWGGMLWSAEGWEQIQAQRAAPGLSDEEWAAFKASHGID